MLIVTLIAWMVTAGAFGFGLYYVYHALQIQNRVWRIFCSSATALQPDIAISTKSAKHVLAVIGSICIGAAGIALWLLTAENSFPGTALLTAGVACVFGGASLLLFEKGDFDEYARYLFTHKPVNIFPRGEKA